MNRSAVTPEIARQIFSNASSDGVSVEIYLQTIISETRNGDSEEIPLSELLKDLTAKIDSSEASAQNFSSTGFGQALRAKFEKQGLKIR